MSIKVKCDKTSAGEVIRQKLHIDLSKNKRDNVNIGAAIEIFIKPERSLTNIFGLKKHINHQVGISLKDVRIADGLVCPDLKLSALIGDRVYSLSEGSTVDVTLQSESTKFQLVFHPDCIIDSTIPQDQGKDEFEISFSLDLRDSEGTVIGTLPVALEIILVPVEYAPEGKFSVKPPEQFDSKAGIKVIGKIEIRDKHTLRRVPAVRLDGTLTATLDGKFLPSDTVWMQVPRVKGLHLDQSRMQFGMDRLDTRADGSDGVNTFAVDVLCDFDKIGNPCDTEDGEADIKLSMSLKYSAEDTPGEVKQIALPDRVFTILENVSQPELKIDLQDPNDGTSAPEAISTDSATVKKRLTEINFLPTQKLYSRIILTLRNPAQEGPSGAGVVVRNIEFVPVQLPPTGVFVPSNRQASLSTLVRLESSRDEIRLPNGEDRKEKIEIVFDGTQTSDLYLDRGRGGRNYHVPLNFKIKFDYLIDDEGEETVNPDVWNDASKARHFELDLSLPVYQEPYPDWLSVDFGTSAIVGLHGGHVIDFHERKKVLQNVQNDNDDRYERGTKFLSSNVIFRDVPVSMIKEEEPVSQLMGNESSTSQYDLMAVCLSPTSRLEDANIRNLLPCLKMMVGYEMLPDIDNYDQFRYWCEPCPGDELARVGLVLEDSADETSRIYSPLAKVDEVFRQVYQQLFHFYVRESLKENSKKVNQLVLTVPNTYSPYHLQKIRNIIQNNLGGFHIRDIRFVSESDAVACYYHTHWKEINQPLHRPNMADLQCDETVLVFDMGAGTLDLTLFTRKRDAKTGNYEIKVLGKIGISKAGNYLDSLLAELLAKHVPSVATYADPEKIIDGDTLKGANALKALIKDTIKPALSDGGEIILARNLAAGIKEEVSIDINRVFLQDNEFKKFVKECTSDLLDNFFSFFSIKDEIRIDTILMSGRSAKLRAIKESLEKTFTRYSAPQARILEVRNFPGNADDDKTKTIVAEGATNYVELVGKTSVVRFEADNLTACYGVIYYGADGNRKYTELLNPRRANPLSASLQEGIMVKQFDSGDMVVDLSHCLGSDRPMILVQTYHADPIKAIEQGLTEYITEVASIDARTLRNRENTHIRLEVNSDNLMRFYINGMVTPELSATKVDVTSKTARRSFWPVIRKTK